MAGILCDDPEARCAQGNFFRFNGENSDLVVEGLVNGQSTGPLPHGERIILPNTLSGTTNQLSVRLRGTTYDICDLNDMAISKPEDVGVMISELPDNSATGGGQTEQDILVCEVSTALAQGSPSVGEVDVDTAPNETLMWVATVILTKLEVIDETIGTRALYAATDGYIDLQMTGTDGAPALAEAVAFLRSHNGRAAVRALTDGGLGALRVIRNSAGVLLLTARLNMGLARQLAPYLASLTRSRMANIIVGTRGQLGRSAPAAVSAGSRIPVVGFIIVGVIDVVEWYSNPSSRGDWSLLFSTLVVDGAALLLSAAAATAAAGFAIGVFAALGAMTVVAAVGVVAVGLLAGLAVGVIATAFVRHTNLIYYLDAGVTAVIDGIQHVAQGAAVVTGTFADTLGQAYDAAHEFMTHTSPRDGRITGPADYFSEIDQGFDDYINSRIKWPRF